MVGTRPSWPQLDRALKLLNELAPCTENEFADQLLDRGLSGTRYALESLIACASWGNRPFDLPVADGVIGFESVELSATRRVIKRLTASQGLASILQISDELVRDGLILSDLDIRLHLKLTPNVVWLDPDHVAASDSSRNRLVNTLRLLLSVHQPVPLAIAQSSVTDFWTFRNAGRTSDQSDLVAPSAAALRAFCIWHTDFAVTFTAEGEALVATVELDHTTELGVEAAMLVELIRSTPDRAVDRTTLFDIAEAVGMSAATVGLYLTYHPAFVPAGYNVWTTLGTIVPADVMATIQDQARQRMRTEAREFRAGSDLDGNVWAAFSVTSNFRMSGVLSKRWVPTDTGPLRIALTDGRGDPCGTVVYSPESGLTHGVGTYIRRFAVQVGQHILITADLNWGTGRIVHGDASLLEGLRRSG